MNHCLSPQKPVFCPDSSFELQLQLLFWGPSRPGVQDAPSWWDPGDWGEEIQEESHWVLLLHCHCRCVTEVSSVWSYSVSSSFDAHSLCGYFHWFPRVGEFVVAPLKHFTPSVAIHYHVFFVIIKTFSKTHTSSQGLAPISLIGVLKSPRQRH